MLANVLRTPSEKFFKYRDADFSLFSADVSATSTLPNTRLSSSCDLLLSFFLSLSLKLMNIPLIVNSPTPQFVSHGVLVMSPLCFLRLQHLI